MQQQTSNERKARQRTDTKRRSGGAVIGFTGKGKCGKGGKGKGKSYLYHTLGKGKGSLPTKW